MMLVVIELANPSPPPTPQIFFVVSQLLKLRTTAYYVYLCKDLCSMTWITVAYY